LESAVIAVAGITLPIVLAPSIYVVYFYFQGWPHTYITHTGPLRYTPYGDLVCFGNFFLLFALPIITLFLGKTILRADQKKSRYADLLFALPFGQVLFGLLNLIPLALLFD